MKRKYFASSKTAALYVVYNSNPVPHKWQSNRVWNPDYYKTEAELVKAGFKEVPESYVDTSILPV